MSNSISFRFLVFSWFAFVHPVQVVFFMKLITHSLNDENCQVHFELFERKNTSPVRLPSLHLKHIPDGYSSV